VGATITAKEAPGQISPSFASSVRPWTKRDQTHGRDQGYRLNAGKPVPDTSPVMAGGPATALELRDRPSRVRVRLPTQETQYAGTGSMRLERSGIRSLGYPPDKGKAQNLTTTLP